MSLTLYRKYRPQTFARVVNQNHIKVTLENEILSGKIAQAYLFSGPHGVGKTTVARILAKALNCQKREGAEPCDKCQSCLEIKEGRSLDLIEIDAASNRGINEIRELREHVRFAPAKESYKVFIIDEVHMLTAEAFNALLKTLEEPPSHAIFVLATTEIHKIPETIISRCQRFDFRKVPLPKIIGHLEEIIKQEKIKVEKKVLENIARHSQGYLRDAISLLGQVLALGEEEVSEEEATLVIPRSDIGSITQFTTYLFNGQAAAALKLINSFIEEGGDLEFFTGEVIEYLRRVLLAHLTNNWHELLWELDKETLSELQSQLSSVRTDYLRKIIEYLLEAKTAMRRAEIIQLPLELVIVKIIEAGPSSAQDYPVNPAHALAVKTQGSGKSCPANPPKTVSHNLQLAEIKQKWPEVIQALKEYNQSLSTFLKVGHPLKLEGQKLTLGFKFSFHWERVKESRNLSKVEEVLVRIFGQRLILAGEIDENLEIAQNQGSPAGQKRENMVERVLNTLGGEFVD